MTDRDVVERAAALFARAVCRTERGLDKGWKPVYVTTLKGAEAASAMTILRPVMSRYRQGQIDRALGDWSPKPIRWRTQPTSCGAES